MSNSLDPDQAQRMVSPDLGSNCLQKKSADNTVLSRTYRLKFTSYDLLKSLKIIFI